jgi:hypothetical protein
MRRRVLLILLLFIACTVSAQYSKHVIFFTDKNETTFTLSNPSVYLSAKSIARKSRHQIAIDSSDLPVIERYIDSVRLAGPVNIVGKSRWLNAVIIQTSDAAALNKIKSFPFVKKSDSVALRSNSSIQPQPLKLSPVTNFTTKGSYKTSEINADTFNYGSSVNQIKIHNGEFLHNIGARGQNMNIAFLDAGYTGYQTNRFFDSARNRNQILGTWDFVSGNSNVNEDNSHGLHCFSIVAAYIPGIFIGSCPESNYFLLRTEDAPTEQIIEEYNWVMGAEYADSAGADIISSSLGYTTFDNAVYNHTYAQMDGNTTVITKMADMAAKKGMLVVNSAGNDGNSSWRYIGAPADGDSVLSIGAVNNSGIIASFSSYGPTSDGQIKPDLVSVGSGTVLSNTSGNVATGGGTSYSCPNLAGMAACLWQLFPEFNNWSIITTLRKSSDRYQSPHEQYGYGLPNMKKAFGILVSESSSMSASITNFTSTLNWNSKDLSSMRYEVERKLPDETVYSKIQTIPVLEKTFNSRSYQTTDIINNSPAGTVSYRIRQVIDTSASGFDAYYIDSATVILSTATSVNDFNINEKKLQLYPNPAQSGITLKFTEQMPFEKLTVQVYNQNGQLVISEQHIKPSGDFIKTISLNKLQSGSYILVLLKDKQFLTSKEFVKQ